MSRATNHLGLHNHLVADGKCRKFVEETKRLIREEVDCTPDAKINLISFNASKTSLTSYLLDDSNDGIWSFSRVNSGSTSRTSFVNLTLPTFVTLLLLSSIIQEMAILIASLN
jgi:hypothetical protein